MDNESKHLPQDLITRILLRLPVKSLLRFKCVCKFWRSLISEPDFARSHFELATPRLVFNAGLGVRTMDFEGSLHSNPISEPIKVDFLPTPSHTPILGPNDFLSARPRFQIVGSCRGFLLLNSNESLYLWNPSTRVHKPIPSSPFYTNVHGYLYGFGYDSSKDDYLVVQVPIAPSSSSPRCLERVQFFSMRTNMWKYIEGINSRPWDHSRSARPGLLFNGAVHWLAYDHDKSREVIIAFDLMEKKLLQIPQPKDLWYDLSYCDLWVHGSFLSLMMNGSDTLEIWVMEKYKIQSSWTETSLFRNGIYYLSPLCSTKSGDLVMNSAPELVKYFYKADQLEKRDYQGSGSLQYTVPMYTESIFSLPGVGEQS
ncbi:F-box/kelch-repeat protein At3g06240-like [Lotus japonicus]|uniref:F-box/kelch-repeat protein At3g06240-like n=1 Tax=Lotus japonicus TaxID=34305 RepID=UPI00258E4C3A|nr:F-box/kelch-repeat protein At3g06240-like [Lotus japonicus]